MQKNRTTRWFLYGFLGYALAAFAVGLVLASNGAMVLGAFCLIGAASCGLKLWMDKTGF